jgi:hypothetical protein
MDYYINIAGCLSFDSKLSQASFSQIWFGRLLLLLDQTSKRKSEQEYHP